MKVLSILAVSVLLWLGESWSLMVLAGVVHGEWLPQMPTIDFASALLVDLAISFFMVMWRVGTTYADEVRKS
jgi:hypothetical protein